MDAEVDENFIDEVAERYLQSQLAAAAAAGENNQALALRFLKDSFILSLKMVVQYYDGILPEGESLPLAISHLSQSSEAEAQELCQRFVSAGWLTSEFELSPTGRALLPDLEILD